MASLDANGQKRAREDQADVNSGQLDGSQPEEHSADGPPSTASEPRRKRFRLAKKVQPRVPRGPEPSQQEIVGLAQGFAGHVLDTYDPREPFKADQAEWSHEVAMTMLGERMDRVSRAKAAFVSLSQAAQLEALVAGPAARAATIVMKGSDS